MKKLLFLLLLLAGSAAAETASFAGTVVGPVPFESARIVIHNLDKRTLRYTVHTTGGKFEAKDLQPGSYEVRAEVPGLQSPTARVLLREGANPPITLRLFKQ